MKVGMDVFQGFAAVGTGAAGVAVLAVGTQQIGGQGECKRQPAGAGGRHEQGSMRNTPLVHHVAESVFGGLLSYDILKTHAVDLLYGPAAVERKCVRLTIFPMRKKAGFETTPLLNGGIAWWAAKTAGIYGARKCQLDAGQDSAGNCL